MRGMRNFIVLVCELVIFALLVIFAVENRRPAQYTFIGNTFTGNVWWTVAGSALLGFLFALFMLSPGTLAARWRSRTLFRERERREQELAELRGEHERLQGEHARVLNERDRLQRSVAAMSDVSATSAEPATSAPLAAPNNGATRTDTQTDMRTDTAVQTTAPETPAGVNEETDQPVARENGWRDRLRRLREGGGSTPDEMGPTESPPAPTA